MAPSWTSQSTPTPRGLPYGDLPGVSCTSASACTAVGAAGADSGPQVTLAERWNGTSWAVQHTPNPTGVRGSSLSAVSCTSVTACVAVGEVSHGSGIDTTTLAERWNGTSWSIQPTPNPAGAADSSLSAVSCTSADACTAVGSTGPSPDTQASLAERWNGTNWTIVPTTTPPGAHGSALSGVSCTGPNTCTAVGDYYTTTPTITQTLIEIYK